MRNPSAASRVQILRPLQRHTVNVSAFADEWLVHTGSPAAPLYLLKAVERACEAMGLGSRRAVIAAGRADNFTTVVGDIHHFVFDKLGPLCPPIPPHLVSPFALIRAPRLEGTVALWHPVLLGHELAHIAVRVHDALSTFDLAASFDWQKARAIPAPGSGAIGLPTALRLYEICTSWAEELICDAFAIRAFGVSGVAALCEYLEAIAATDLLSDTHPPGRLRNHMLIGWLGALGEPRLDAIVTPWRTLATQDVQYPEPWAQFLVETLQDRQDDILATARTWPGDDYESNGRASVVVQIAEGLQAGMPPDVSVMDAGSRKEVREPDVVAAGWIGRVEGFETPVDQLATKALARLSGL